MISTHPNYPERFSHDYINNHDKFAHWKHDVAETANKTWNEIYLKYRPEYTDPSVKANEGKWADYSDVSYDVLKRRKTWINNKLVPLSDTKIKFVDGKPVTPITTGLTGRGMLGRYGPNHAADPIVTRYNPQTGDLEFVAGLRADTNDELWCIPGGMVDEGEPISVTLRREFKEEVARNCSENILDRIFDKKNGTVLYAGPTYGDPRTTDQAWIETYVVHYHIDDKLAKMLPLTHQEGENRAVKWISCDTENLYGDHKRFIELAKENQKEKEYSKITFGAWLILMSAFAVLYLMH